MSDAPSTPNPIERIATVFGGIVAAVRRGLGSNQARLEGPVQGAIYNLINRRLNQTRDRLIRLAERLQAGWIYVPKPFAPRKPTTRPPREPNPLTTGSHWLLRAAPGLDMGCANAGLYQLFHEPEIAAVLAAAPVPAWRIVRSVCWALGVRKPAILGPSKPPKPGKPVPVPPPPLPWTIVPMAEPDMSYYHAEPRYYWPRVRIVRPKTT
jgi:hypothetical protein